MYVVSATIKHTRNITQTLPTEVKRKIAILITENKYFWQLRLFRNENKFFTHFETKKNNQVREKQRFFRENAAPSKITNKSLSVQQLRSLRAPKERMEK